jgi:hypothetical protein
VQLVVDDVNTGVDPTHVPSTSQPTVLVDAHPMITRTRDGTRRFKKYTNGTIRYDPQHCSFFVTPTSHRDGLREPSWRDAMIEEFLLSNALIPGSWFLDRMESIMWVEVDFQN